MTHTKTFTLEERALDALCDQRIVRLVNGDKYGRVHAIRNATPGDPRNGEGQRVVEIIGIDGSNIYHSALGYDEIDWDPALPPSNPRPPIPDLPEQPS